MRYFVKFMRYLDVERELLGDDATDDQFIDQLSLEVAQDPYLAQRVTWLPCVWFERKAEKSGLAWMVAIIDWDPGDWEGAYPDIVEYMQAIVYDNYGTAGQFEVAQYCPAFATLRGHQVLP